MVNFHVPMMIRISNIRGFRIFPVCHRYIIRFSSSSSSSPPPSAENKSPDNDQEWFNTQVEADIDERVVPKPISYLPDHLPQTRKRQKQKPWWKFRYFVDIEAEIHEENEYTETPEYPPIFDPSPEGVKKKIREEWYQAIRRLPTAQQKIYEITKHYAHLNYLLEPVMKQYNFLPTQQFITRTSLISGLPKNYAQADLNLDEQIGRNIVQMIGQRLYETESRLASTEFKKTSLSSLGFLNQHPDVFVRWVADEDILTDVIQMIRNYHQPDHNVQFDYNPFVGTSWWVPNSPIPFIKKKWFGDKDTTTQCFTYRGNHCVHVRGEKPLAPIVPWDDEICTQASSVPDWRYNLLRIGVPLRRHNIMSLPGFWPDHSDGFDFPYVLGHSREDIRLRHKSGFKDTGDDQDVMDGMAITSAFAWLTSIANNLGFTLYDQLTYPLVTQVIITDGQRWSFYIYQLNDHCFHDDLVKEDDPPRRNNICWSSGDMVLFNELDSDGRPTNLNRDVLNLLVKFATAEPLANVETIDLRPYLGTDDRTQQDIDELNYSLRRKFSNTYSKFIARRKKVNLWEKIYKQHKDAPIDLKRIRPKIEFKHPPFFQ